MKNLHTEYKILLLGFVIVFIIIGIFLIKDNVFGFWSDQWNTSKLSTCTSIEHTGVLDYTDVTCTYKDDAGRTSVISYPEFDSKDYVFVSLSSSLKETANQRKRDTKYVKTEQGYELEEAYPMNYRTFHYGDIMSIIMIYSEEQLGNSTADQYVTYMVDLSKKEIINQRDFQRENNLTSSFSARLKTEIITLYQKEYNYSYYQAGNDAKKVEVIDSMIESFSYQNLENFYVNSSGKICLIINLYNPKKFRKSPYFFQVSENGTIRYSELLEG